MKTAIFYLLTAPDPANATRHGGDDTVADQNIATDTVTDNSLTGNRVTSRIDTLNDSEILACELAAQQWRAGKRVLIACDNEQQAITLDEALWQRPVNSFVPHNLAGEGPRGGAPVELCWPQKRGNSPRDLLISLLTQVANFASTFPEVIDFVPYDDTGKQQARERYKAYRLAGFHLNTATPPNGHHHQQ